MPHIVTLTNGTLDMEQARTIYAPELKPMYDGAKQTEDELPCEAELTDAQRATLYRLRGWCYNCSAEFLLVLPKGMPKPSALTSYYICPQCEVKAVGA